MLRIRNKSSKYCNQPVVVDGHRFASQREARRYGELKLLEKAGEISGLELQPRFLISVNGVHVCSYSADFRYEKDGRHIVEDVKGVRTPTYRLKKRLMQAVHGVTISEV